MSFQNFIDEIKKGLPLPLYVLYTSDPFLCKEAVYEITKLVPETEREFNLHVFDLTFSDGENVSMEHVLNVANTVSFFGSRRFTLLIVDLHKLSNRELERLKTYVRNPSQDGVFIILNNGSLKKDIKESFRELKIFSLDVRDTELQNWISHRLRIKGVEISEKALDFLLGSIGNDLGLLSAEIEKISLLGKKKIEVDDMTDILAVSKDYNAFDMVKALMRKDADTVFRIYSTLKNALEDHALVGVLNWQYGQQLYTGNIKKSKDYFLKIFEILTTTDIDLKSSGRRFPLEYLLIKLLRL